MRARILSKEYASLAVSGKPFRWLRLAKLRYEDDYGVEREWESVERIPRGSSKAERTVDGVAILARLHSGIDGKSGQPLNPRIVLVSQFRPPTGRRTLELPAGLLDSPDEDPVGAALRELKEETGYSARAADAQVDADLAAVSDPGLSNTNLVVVRVDVDDALHGNGAPSPQPDEGESIEVHLLPLGPGLLPAVRELCRSRGFLVHAQLYQLALGLAMAAPTARL